MKMTDTQAAEYCKSKALLSLSRSSPSGEEDSHSWSHLRDEIERDGLDIVEARLVTLVDNNPRNAYIDIANELLAAIYDEEHIEPFIAADLKVKVIEEIDKQESYPLRALYLKYLRDHLGNVEDGTADLEDFEEAREDMERQLHQYELEYGAWITSAMEAQEE